MAYVFGTAAFVAGLFMELGPSIVHVQMKCGGPTPEVTVNHWISGGLMVGGVLLVLAAERLVQALLGLAVAAGRRISGPGGGQ